MNSRRVRRQRNAHWILPERPRTSNRMTPTTMTVVDCTPSALKRPEPASATGVAPASAARSSAPSSRVKNELILVGHERADGKRAYSRSVENEERMCRSRWNSVALFSSMSELNVWLEAAPANQVKSKKPRAQPVATPPADDPSSSSDSDSSSS
eukprot:scaffold53455_cov41-Cyclotella_meneghiniana.AAC.11